MSKMRFLAGIIGALALILAGVGVQDVYAAPTDLIISEYTEGTSFNKAVEIFNGTGASVDLGAGQYRLELYSNGSATVTQGIALTGVIADGDVFVISHGSADAAILAVADLNNNTVINFNGDDGLVLRKGGVGGAVVDSFGQIGTDPGAEWGTGLTSTADNTLRRKSTICAGDTLINDAFDPAVEWDGFAVNTFDGFGAHSVSCTVTDIPPTVASSTPANGATNVAVGSNITINFSEEVSVGIGAVTLDCGTFTTTPALPATITPPTTLILDPVADLAPSTVCTVTVLGANVTDTDGTPDAMVADYTFSFTTAAPPTITRIHTIQGLTDTSPENGNTVTVEAIVVGTYQGGTSTGLRGFFIQEEDADVDANPATSEGLFVFCNTCTTPVAIGDRVQVTGTVSEFQGVTQITASTVGSIVIGSNSNTLPTPATLTLPVPITFASINDYYEQFESMRVSFSNTLTVSEYFEMARAGQIVLYEGGRPYQYTHTDNTPTVAEYNAHLDNLARRRMILDDTNNFQNAPLGTTEVIFHPQPGGLSTGTQGVNFFRGGDTVSNLTGILHFSWAGYGANTWRIRPTPTNPVTFTPVNTRPSAPAVTGDVVVASFNVLNYFTTVDTTASTSTGPCAPSATLDCRGADSATELTRQTDKLVTALVAIDADIFGLIEIQNTTDSSTVASLVASLNAVVGAGTYGFVNTGGVGTDAITNAFIYKTAVVQVVNFFIDTDAINDRPTLAALFEVIDPLNPSFGEQFHVVVNHFKSKGSAAGLPGDTDQGDGQAQSNATRVAQATRLRDWVTATLVPLDPDVLVIGDLNSYKGEDPITLLRNAGYTDLVEQFGGANAYSYVFDGQLGYLDHALANASLLPYITDTQDWHINADEIPLFDYNDAVEDSPGEASFEREPNANPLYEVNPYRTSDHDPVLVGISFPQIAPIVTNLIEIDGAGSLVSTNPATPVVLTTTVSNIAVTFSVDVLFGTASADDADNLDNYIVLAEGAVAGFQTTGINACVTGVNVGDTEVIPTGVVYNNTTRTATLSFAPPLGVGKYSLIVCGSTSIVSLVGGVPLNNGQDVQYYFDVEVVTTPPIEGGGNTATTTTGTLTQQEILETVTGLPATGETPLWADNLRVALLIGIMSLVVLIGGIFTLKRRTR
jgi:predicted extracellular nuclease